MKLAFTSFIGANSDLSPPLLPENFAVEATNVFTDQGALNTWKSLKQVGISPVWNSKTGTIKSLFLLNNATWLAWGESVHVAPMQIESNTDWRVVFTGTDKPRYTDKNLATASGTAYPDVSYALGVPAPTVKLVATKTAKSLPSNSIKAYWEVPGTVADAIGDRIARTYVYTYVSVDGQEGPPSDPADYVYTNDDENVTLTALTGNISAPAGDYNITKARIYSAAAGGTFNYLKEVALPQSSVVISDNTVGSAIETTLWSPPPASMVGVVAMANGMLAAYSGNNLYFSEPFQSQAWPEDYIVPMDFPIKGLRAIGNMLFVSTEGNPVMITANHPSQAKTSYNKLGSKQANVSDRSMVDMGNGAMYASKDGIVFLANGAATMISDGIMSERVYQQLVPSSIHAYFYRDKYFAFYNSGQTGSITADTGEVFPAKGAFILDPQRKCVTFTDVWADAAYSDKVTGKLYLCRNESNVNNLYEWNEGASVLAMAWMTKPIVTTPTNLSVARVWADSYPLTFELYADGTKKLTKTVTSDEPFSLPAGYKGRKWQVRVSGSVRVNGIFMANAVSELRI